MQLELRSKLLRVAELFCKLIDAERPTLSILSHVHTHTHQHTPTPLCRGRVIKHRLPDAKLARLAVFRCVLRRPSCRPFRPIRSSINNAKVLPAKFIKMPSPAGAAACHSETPLTFEQTLDASAVASSHFCRTSFQSLRIL